MRKPREFTVIDSYNDPRSYCSPAYISSRIHRLDGGKLGLSISYQADMESRDLWLLDKDIEKLISGLTKQLEYIRGITQ